MYQLSSKYLFQVRIENIILIFFIQCWMCSKLTKIISIDVILMPLLQTLPHIFFSLLTLNLYLPPKFVLNLQHGYGTRFFYKQHFHKQRQAEIGKKLNKSYATPWGRTFVKNVQINKWESFNESIWLIAMTMKMIMKNKSCEL